jgi:phosphohistidine phosphatase
MSMQAQIMLRTLYARDMASTLWLLRHGDAEPAAAGGDDFGRRLTARGEQEASAAGLALAGMGVDPEHVFTSPRVRARDTALLACSHLGVKPLIHEPLAGDFDERGAAELAAATADEAALLLVGHEPDLSRLVAALTGARVELRKGGMAAIRAGTLVALLRPREIQLIAGR